MPDVGCDNQTPIVPSPESRSSRPGIDLGANQLQTFIRITLPNISNAILGSALLVFILSFDEIAITFLLTGSENTLPMLVWAMLRRGVTPEICAIATITVVSSTLLVLVGVRFLGNQEKS